MKSDFATMPDLLQLSVMGKHLKFNNNNKNCYDIHLTAANSAFHSLEPLPSATSAFSQTKDIAVPSKISRYFVLTLHISTTLLLTL